jgi:hypothetical protein
VICFAGIDGGTASIITVVFATSSPPLLLWKFATEERY